ncbi:hypothetical protein SAMN02745146_0850 [Hymenobacter daecheongensis DSM 21074]|uniref:Outer membrane protein beta-barrel domain-containing protein n=1 Tax=Hymenobacter daecheongensis DSM 21074 TaxID=1121955 RepID=A0A1M6B2A4_9BACT|nr:hypothetical protein [Hymenobacter daecheongensis]SHI42874.1 hypothetical protein SAMN02745146_0850 [Hymenobacter daecheongensis DSM 21074]
MQKFVLSTLLAGATISVAQAQTKPGTVLLGGSVSYNSGKSEATTSQASTIPKLATDISSRQVSFSPQVGFFVANNLVLGLNAGVSSDKTTSSQDSYSGVGTPVAYANEEILKELHLGPFVRYYHMFGEKAGLYGQVGGGYHRSTRENSSEVPFSYDSESKTTGGYANLLPGFVYFPTPKIGLELTMGNIFYSKSSYTSQVLSPNKSESKGNSNRFGANFGLHQLAVGASFHLGN